MFTPLDPVAQLGTLLFLCHLLVIPLLPFLLAKNTKMSVKITDKTNLFYTY